MTDTRRKKQPTAEQLRDELRRAAGTIEAQWAAIAELRAWVRLERALVDALGAQRAATPWQRLLRWWRS